MDPQQVIDVAWTAIRFILKVGGLRFRVGSVSEKNDKKINVNDPSAWHPGFTAGVQFLN